MTAQHSTCVSGIAKHVTLVTSTCVYVEGEGQHDSTCVRGWGWGLDNCWH
jgi:hypothetical protein